MTEKKRKKNVVKHYTKRTDFEDNSGVPESWFKRQGKYQKTITGSASKTRVRNFGGVLKHPIGVNVATICFMCIKLEPYGECMHRCKYCYASGIMATLGRHFYDDWSPTEVRIGDVQYLRNVMKRAFRGRDKGGELVNALRNRVPIHMSVMTDPFQPIEKTKMNTLEMLKILREYEYPTVITTKADYVSDSKWRTVLDGMIVVVQSSITTMDDNIAANIEPNAARPTARMRMLRELSESGIPTAIRICPYIPTISDDKEIVDRGFDNGVKRYNWGILKMKREYNAVLEKVTGKNFMDYYASIGKQVLCGNFVVPDAKNQLEMFSKIKRYVYDIDDVMLSAETPDTMYLLGDNLVCCSLDGIKGFKNFNMANMRVAQLEVARGMGNNVSFTDFLNRYRRHILSEPHSEQLRYEWNNTLGWPLGMESDGEVDEYGDYMYHFNPNDERIPKRDRILWLMSGLLKKEKIHIDKRSLDI